MNSNIYNKNYTCFHVLEKKAKLKELSNNISNRSEAKGTGIMSDLLLARAKRGEAQPSNNISER